VHQPVHSSCPTINHPNPIFTPHYNTLHFYYNTLLPPPLAHFQQRGVARGLQKLVELHFLDDTQCHISGRVVQMQMLQVLISLTLSLIFLKWATFCPKFYIFWWRLFRQKQKFFERFRVEEGSSPFYVVTVSPCCSSCIWKSIPSI